MWRPIEGYGAALGDCGCGCNRFGAAGPPARRFPAIEQALRDYIAAKLSTGQYFYISPALNTATLRQATFGAGSSASWDSSGDSSSWGGATGSWGADSSGGGSILADPISSAASTIGTFFSTLWGNSPPPSSGVTMDPNGVTGTWDPTVSAPASTAAPIVNSLPSDLKPAVGNAALSDLFGNPLSPWIIGGAAALLLVAGLAAAVPSHSGRRRRR